jgi:hypothetical protein
MIGRTLAWMLLVIATLLLASFGGAILAAPVTLPLLFIAARRVGSHVYRIWAGVIVALTAAECVWALTYFAQGESTPAIWLLPVLGAVASFVGYTLSARRSPIGWCSDHERSRGLGGSGSWVSPSSLCFAAHAGGVSSLCGEHVWGRGCGCCASGRNCGSHVPRITWIGSPSSTLARIAWSSRSVAADPLHGSRFPNS